MENIRAFFNYVDDFKIEQFKAKEKLRKERGYSVLGNTDFVFITIEQPKLIRNIRV